MSLPKAYLESSVISYLAARESRDPIVAAHQQLTRDWWFVMRAVARLSREMGYEPPTVVTPEELMEA